MASTRTARLPNNASHKRSWLSSGIITKNSTSFQSCRHQLDFIMDVTLVSVDYILQLHNRHYLKALLALLTNHCYIILTECLVEKPLINQLCCKPIIKSYVLQFPFFFKPLCGQLPQKQLPLDNYSQYFLPRQIMLIQSHYSSGQQPPWWRLKKYLTIVFLLPRKY